MEPPTKNSGNKKSGGQNKGTVEFGKIFGYDVRKQSEKQWIHVKVIVETRFISTNG
jgi:hypothetical protein